MESVEAKVIERFVIETKVKRLENVERQIRSFIKDNNTITERENMGWYVQFEGSWESLSLGMEKPAWTPGDKIKITMERILDAKPC